MKSAGILHSEISLLVANLGHGDEVVISDYGFPVPDGIHRIDLAVTAGVPDFLTVLRTVLSELCVEEAILAEELKGQKGYLQSVVETLPCRPQYVSHRELKLRSNRAKSVIRTGEWTPYANVILRAGVPF
ncbi:D-ribose pyranase [Alicyclobacillus shizuokensis]|uniref:D-ribose pyranase n=1 Tax=Alicyclobacillus shizuokensis TaxID=392014 RepID=UPI0009F8EFDB|nr:D-ribose pyranase [Alicyclobacillus shizuokensis]